MKIYKVKVNGKLYEVELESVSETAAKIESPKPVAKTEVTPVNPANTLIKAPMQGTILKTTVVVGAKVQRGSVLAILEAMKLENEIQSPIEGTVKEILVTKGQKVDNNQLLLIIG